MAAFTAAAIPAMTEKGRAELFMKANGLQNALRRILLLVDDHSRVSDMQQKVPIYADVLPASLTSLADEGYIVDAASPDGQQALAAEADTRDLNGIQENLYALAVNVVGKEGADTFRTHCVAAPPRSRYEIKLRINQCTGVIRSRFGAEMADGFEREASKILKQF
jgi:hypothetical protein